MMGGPRHLMSQESLKPKNAGQTLARLGKYLKPYWLVGIMVVILVLVSTWAQVTSPDLTGQLVDCYLTPGINQATGGSFPGLQVTSQSQSNCWLAGTPAGITQKIIKAAVTLGGFSAPLVDGSIDDTGRIAGLGRVVLVLIGLYVIGAITFGLMVFGINWAGQHVCASCALKSLTTCTACTWATTPSTKPAT